MKFSIMALLAGLSLYLIPVDSLAANKHYSTPSDLGVINQERILYWLEKRGELAANASDSDKAQAIKQYLSGKTFKRKKLPGLLGQKVLLAENIPFKNQEKSTSSKGLNKSQSSQEKINANDVETTVKVLAIMIDFQDLKHDDNADIGNQDVSNQHYNDLLFATNRSQSLSAYQYYQQESGGTLFFTGQAQGWVTAENDAAHYGGNDPDNNDDDLDVPSLVTEAVTKAVSELDVDLSEYDKTDLFDLDNDGNVNEPDGIIDHVMIFHASVGEEAGGGSLGEDAIWSHRYFVFDDNNQPVDIPGSDIKLYGYTINPIDAQTGVVVHEFGHDLGLPDEYDTENGTFGSPVADWSVMASGTWVNGGANPSSFSAYATDYLSERYQGNWINQQLIEFDNLSTETISLVSVNNHDGNINQIKVELPPAEIDFTKAFAGDYQYYSGQGHLMTNSLSFNTTLPTEPASLTMMAHWDIEVDYDYVQIKINGDIIAGNHTKVDNEFHSDVHNFISGSSADIDSKQGELSWVELTFDLTAYASQAVTIELVYVTDPAVGGYGFVADDIRVTTEQATLFTSGAENDAEVTLNGFSRVSDTVAGENHHYYMHLRDFSGNDSKLVNEGYESGVLVWYRDENVSDNQVNSHPGQVFIGVVDADQDVIKSGQSIRNTNIQLKDAAFRFDDNALFSDKQDYSAPLQPESGINLPTLGLVMEIDSQSDDSSMATVSISKQDVAEITDQRNGFEITVSIDDPNLQSDSLITWVMGDGTTLTGNTVTHTYATSGEYLITASYQGKMVDRTIIVGAAITGTIDTTINGKSISFVANLSGGLGDLNYRWNFGDQSELSQSISPTHDYETFGTFNVTLAVTDETLQTYHFTSTVEVIEVLVPLEASITSTQSNLTVNYKGSATGGDGVYTYLWDFGDDTTSSLQNPSHSYSQAGTFTATLTVTDGSSATTSITATRTVQQTAVVTPTKSTSSSGGGSFSIMSLFFLLLTRMVIRNIKPDSLAVQ